MPRYKVKDGVTIQFTAEEEAARDAEEQAWADDALARAQQDLRQNLRDLPSGKDTVEKCENVTWPTKP